MAMTAWLAKLLDQFDLLVGERAHLLVIDAMTPISSSSLSIGTNRMVRYAAELDAATARDRYRIALLRREVDNVDNLLRLQRMRPKFEHGRAKALFCAPRLGWRRAMCNGEAERLPVEQIHVAEVRFANAGRVREHGLEHRLQLTWRLS